MGVVRVGVRRRVVVPVRAVERDGAAGASGAVAVVFAGTSWSCGCADVSPFAICRSRESVVSCVRLPFALSFLHAPATSASDSASGASKLLRLAMRFSGVRCEMNGRDCVRTYREVHSWG